MKISHWSVRYQALQQFDPLTRVKRNLRPLQVRALLAARATRGPARGNSTHENRQVVYTQGE